MFPYVLVVSYLAKKLGYLILAAIFRNKTPPSPEEQGVTIEDTEMENFHSKAKFTSAEGCIGT
jgi:hypothetical protein